MNELETMLRDAAEADAVTFDHEDVRRGVHRRQRARVAMGAVAVALVFAVGFAVMGRGADDARVASESGLVGALTVAELTADRWVPQAYSAVIFPPEGAFIEFGDDGVFLAVFGCEMVTAQWSAVDDALEFRDVDDGGSMCEDGDRVGFVDLMRSGVVAERFGSDDSLSLRSGEDFVAFRRFDRLGAVPSPSTLAGAWNAGGGTSLDFGTDGSVTIGARGCEATTRYEIDGDRIVFADDLSDGVQCEGADEGGVGFLGVGAKPRARIENAGRSRSLWLSTELGVLALTRVADTSDPPTGQDQRSAKDVAESVMSDVFGVSAVTMSVDDDGGLVAVTMEVDGEEVVARLEGTIGSFSVVDVAAPQGDMVFVAPDGVPEFRVAFPESGRLTVTGITGEGEPRSSDVVFTSTIDVDDAGMTERIDRPEVGWITAELVTDRGPTLYLLSRV